MERHQKACRLVRQQSHGHKAIRTESKERRSSDLRNGFRALPDAPVQQRTSGPARAIVEDRVI